MTAVLVGCLLFMPPLPGSQPHADYVRPEVVVPTPEASVIRTTPSVPVTGQATWYAYHEGQAAAGPWLRRALGKHWRGTNVTVWRGKAHIRVTLTDWCWCPKGHRVIDLDIRDFAKLGDPYLDGVIDVRVTR